MNLVSHPIHSRSLTKWCEPLPISMHQHFKNIYFSITTLAYLSSIHHLKSVVILQVCEKNPCQIVLFQGNHLRFQPCQVIMWYKLLIRLRPGEGYTLPETNSSHPKIGSWYKWISFWDPGLFSGANLLLISGRVRLCSSWIGSERFGSKTFSNSVDFLHRSSQVVLEINNDQLLGKHLCDPKTGNAETIEVNYDITLK